MEPNTLDIRINHTSTGDSKEKKRQQKHSTSLESGAGPVPNTRDLNQVRNTKKQKRDKTRKMWSIGSKEHSAEVVGGSAPQKESAKVLQVMGGDLPQEPARETGAKAYGTASDGEQEGEEVLKKNMELTDQAYLQMSKKNFELYAKQLLNRKELNQLMREVQKHAFKDEGAKPGTRNTPGEQRKGTKSPIDPPQRRGQHKNQKTTGVVLPI